MAVGLAVAGWRVVRFPQLFGVITVINVGDLHGITRSLKSLTCLVLSIRTVRPAAIQRVAHVLASVGALVFVAVSVSLSTKMLSRLTLGRTGKFAMLVLDPIAHAGGATAPRRMAPSTVSIP